MDPYDRRETFQSDNSGLHGPYDNHNYDPYGQFLDFSAFLGRTRSVAHPFSPPPFTARRGDTDTESEQDVYARNYAPSAESLNPGFRSGVSDISNTVDYAAASVREPYPAWTSERQIPLSKESVFLISSRFFRVFLLLGPRLG